MYKNHHNLRPSGIRFECTTLVGLIGTVLIGTVLIGTVLIGTVNPNFLLYSTDRKLTTPRCCALDLAAQLSYSCRLLCDDIKAA